MAGAWDAKVEISTADATLNLRTLKTEAAGLAAALRALDTEVVAGQKNIQAMTKEFTGLLVAQRQVIAAQKDQAAASIAQAKADGVTIVNNNRIAESEARVAVLEERRSAIAEQGATSAARTSAIEEGAALRRDQAAQRDIANAERRTIAEGRAATAAEAAARSSNADLTLSDNLSNSRYLLYDVGATYGVLSAALLAIPMATAAVSAAYQADFAQVLRVTHQTADEASGLRQNLKDLATQIPLTFADLANITQIGAQMGIRGNASLTAFTETVAKFTVVTGIATDTAATLFGRLQNMFPDESKSSDFFNNIGSAIAKVGADTVATDPQIASMAVQIAAVGSSAGFTAAQTIGLSAALASVAVQPELARSSLTRLFGKLNLDVADGSSKMNAFAAVLKTTTAQASSLWQSDPSQFFTQLVGGLHAVQQAQGGTGLTQTLQSLGITSVRDVSVLTRLAVGYDTLATSMKSAGDAAQSGTALDEMSKPVFTTLASQLKEIGSAIKNLMDTMGSSSLGPVTYFLDMVKGLITGFDTLIRTVPGFQVLLGVGAVLAIVAGSFLALKTAQAFALAGLVGFQQVAGKAGISSAMSLNGILQQLVKTWLMAGGASADAATEMLASSGMMRSAGLALSGNAASLNTALAEGETRSTGFGSAMRGAGSALLGLLNPTTVAVTGVLALAFAFGQSQQAADAAAKAIGDAMSAGDGSGALEAISKQLQQLKVDTFNAGGGAMLFAGDMGKSMQDIANESGISFGKVIAAVAKTQGGMEAFRAEVDKVAQAKGFKDLNDWNAKSPLGGTDLDLSRLNTLVDGVNKLGDGAAKSAADNKQAADATSKLGGAAAGATDSVTGLSTGLDTTASAASDADKAIKSYIDDIFSLMDASMATNDSLEKLGGSLAKSTSLSMNDANGRDNLKNIQDSLKNAALEQQNLINQGQETAQQAATNYAAFIDGLMKKLSSMGVDVSQIQGLASQASSVFDSEMQKNPPTVTAKVDTSKVKEATDYLDSVVATYGTTNISMLAQITGTDVVGNNVYAMQQYIEAATGQPYVAKVNSDTKDANTNVSNMVDYFGAAIFGTSWSPVISADVSAAITNVSNFVNWALDALSKVGGIIGGAADGAKAVLGAVFPGPTQVTAKAAPTVNARPNVPAPPPQVDSGAANAGASAGADAANKSLGALTDGYDNAAKAAGKAGSAGQKAGKDAANGIDAATAAVNDYASRLQTSLTAAYDKQYGMQIATDNYQKALNAIADKRAADLKSVSDLIDKQKQLNDAMNTDLVDANKAKTEQAISLKYGEGARAADYGNQAQTALDNAAAKKKEMDADAAQQKTLQDGIGNLNGNSNAAIANREAVRGLETQMIAMIDAYAKTGASQQQVTDYAAKMGLQFQSDVTQAGFSSKAVQDLTGDVGRYIDAVKAVPPTVNTNTTTSGTGPAGSALDGVRNAALGIPTHVNTDVTLTGASLWQTPNFTSDHQPIYDVLSNGHRTGTRLFNEGGQVPGFADGGQIPGTPPANPRVDNLMAQVDGKGMIRVRSKEFIQPQEAVDYYGLDFMNQIRKMQLPRFNFGGQVGGGGGAGRGAGSGAMLVELTASNIAAIARLADQQINLYTNDEIIAHSANRGNTTLATKGFS